MSHIRSISRAPQLAQGGTSPLETIIILLTTVIFQDWDNFPQVIQQLSKFYAKTPN
jgi:hypothetical protein